MHPSIDELIIYPEALNKMFIFSYMSTNISFSLFLLTETFEADDDTVWAENTEKFPIFFKSNKLCFC